MPDAYILLRTVRIYHSLTAPFHIIQNMYLRIFPEYPRAVIIEVKVS
jgi:hypothetical protein